FLKLPKTPIIVCLFVFFSYKGSLTGGFNDYFYNAGYIITISIFIIMYLIAKFLLLITKGVKI
ncbi:MAG: hypothetical protein K5978_05135, partial [Campylobacter sp.]|nr:hypothetical protein [Campylobacter sp.]